MKKLIFFIDILLVSVSNCSRSIQIVQERPVLPVDLKSISLYESEFYRDSLKSVTFFKDLDLTKISTDKTIEYIINEKKLFSINQEDKCQYLEVYKENFLIATKFGCWASGPESIHRDSVIITDLNTLKTYKANFGEGVTLSPSKEFLDLLYPHSKKTYAILYVDLQTENVVIHNNFENKVIKLYPLKD